MRLRGENQEEWRKVRRSVEVLLVLQQAGVAGNALPLALIHHLCVVKAPDMLVRLTLVCALGVINTRDHGRIPEEVHLQVLNVGQ